VANATLHQRVVAQINALNGLPRSQASAVLREVADWIFSEADEKQSVHALSATELRRWHERKRLSKMLLCEADKTAPRSEGVFDA